MIMYIFDFRQTHIYIYNHKESPAMDIRIYLWWSLYILYQYIPLKSVKGHGQINILNYLEQTQYNQYQNSYYYITALPIYKCSLNI